MKLTRQLFLAVALIVLALISPRASVAQDYSFSVPLLQMQVFVQPNGTARVVYDITFQNSTFGAPIDVVDIGLPNAASARNFASMQASMNGVALDDIRRSEFVDPGVEVHLDGQTIQGGESGTLHFEFVARELIYQDVTRQGFVSLRITPTWYGSQFVEGNSDVKIAIHMLPGIPPEELFYQNTPFTSLARFQDHTVAVWEFNDTRATGPHLVGLSFPERGITSGIIRQSVLDLADLWLRENATLRWVLGALAIGLFGFLFFRFSGGTGISVFVILSAGLIGLFYVSPLVHLCSFIPLAGLILFNELGLRQKRKEYLPAIAQVEGGGIKRGLTAPEAAVLLEMPLSRVLGLVIFGLLKKRVVTQEKDTPLIVKVADEYAMPPQSGKERAAARLKAAQKNGIVLQTYEQGFLDALEAKPGVPVSQIDFGGPMKNLISGVADRMKGFDLSDTQDYYQAIVKRAVTEAQSIGDVPLKEQAIDRNLEWILMDQRHPTILQTGGWNYRPVWTRPVVFGGGPSSSAGKGSSSGPGGRTSFGDVSAGFAGWAENTMGGLASAILPGSLQVNTPRGGVIDLSGADKLTGDIFKAMAESSSKGGRSGGGRSGGGCACACAGCACACACAGGGR